MKNIKKSLALVLAFVMILGLCTIGAGAAFNDASSINKTYATAVEVMSGMGILAGSDDDGDGKFDFNPTGNLTRAAAAKMITYMILGKDAAERLPAKAMFDDVKASDWSAKYVYYLANKGIINGLGDGKFGPNDSVTATQLAKMLLAAVGYGKADEFVGPGWDVNVFSYATDLNVYKNTEAADYDVAATREEAALYVFNTMTRVNLVNYNAEDLLYTEKLVNNAVVKFADSKYNYASIEGIITGVKESGNAYTQLTYTNEYYVNSVLTKEAKTISLNVNVPAAMLGHKVAVYYNTKVETDDNNKTYFNAYYVEDLSKEAFMFFTKHKDMYNALGGKNMEVKAYSLNKDTYNPVENFSYWNNGVNVTYDAYGPTNTYGSYMTTTYSKDELARQAGVFPLTSDYSLIGSFILDDDGKTIGYKASSTTMTKVTEVNTKAGSEYIKLQHNPLGAATNKLENNSNTDIVNAYDGIAKGDIVNVAKVGDIYTITKANIVKDVYVSSLVNDGLGNLTKINGQYSISSSTSFSTFDWLTFKTTYTFTVTEKNTYNLYLDPYGSYGYAELVDETVKDLAFVTYVYATGINSTLGVPNYYAKCVDQTGSVVDYLITDATFTDLCGNTAAPATVAVNKLYTLKTKTDSTYYSKQTVAVLDNAPTKSKINEVLDSSYRININDGKNYYLTSETLYVYVSVAANNKVTVITSNSKPAINDACSAYFYPIAINGSTTNFDVNVVFITDGKPASTAGTSFIYSSANDTGNSKHSYIASKLVNADGNLDYFLCAFIEAEYKTDFKIDTDMAGLRDSYNVDISTDNTYLNGGFYSYEVDGDGYYTLTKYDASGDSNRVVNCLQVDSLYNGKLTTKGANATTGVDALNVADATVVDFTKYGVTTIDDIQSYVEQGYKVYVSCWSYNYDYYYTQYGAGNSSAKTSTLYVNSIVAP